MKVLYLLRGVPGSGKSTLLKQFASVVEGYVISADQVRLMYSPTVYPKNQLSKKINPENDQQVWDFIHQLVKERLLKGYTTIVDATHCNTKAIDYYKSFCGENDVRCIVVEFNVDKKECKLRNAFRPGYQSVPDKVIDRMFEQKKEPVPNWCESITAEEFKDILHKINNDETDYESLDYNKFEEIVIFGDVHGCYEPIKKYFDDYPVSCNKKYIFVGDYEDRGIQNKEVFDFLLSHKRDGNFLFLKGNHTRHTLDFSQGDQIVSKEFKERTAKQLESFDKRELKKFCKRQGAFVYFTFRGQKFLVTHAGVPNIPNTFTNEYEMVNGVGGYQDSERIDEYFRVKHPDVFTVHGHRNLHNVPYNIGLHTGYFNLEGQVEFGKFLRVLVLKDSGDGVLKPVCLEIKNDVFRDVNSSEDIIDRMKNSNLIRAKELENGIVSYAFTKECMFDSKWDDLNIRARGLFCRDTQCVARSFDKFFNIGERESLEDIAKKFQYPVNSFRKENGYLGIVSYDKQTEDLFVSSKNTTQSSFAKYFKELLCKNDNKLYNKIKELLKNMNYSLVFEVCDSKKDPHMVKYAKPTLFLLEAFENSLQEYCLPYKDLVSIAETIGVNVKVVDKVLYNEKEFLEYIKSHEDINSSWSDRQIEGFVLEDSKHYRVKYKTRWYRFWKAIRNHQGVFDIENFKKDWPEYTDCLTKVNVYIKTYGKDKFMIKNLNGQETFSVIKLRDELGL